MTETKKSPEQMPLCFDESVSSDVTGSSVRVTNVISVDFARRRTSSSIPAQVELCPQAERSIIGQVLERARSLNW